MHEFVYLPEKTCCSRDSFHALSSQWCIQSVCFPQKLIFVMWCCLFLLLFFYLLCEGLPSTWIIIWRGKWWTSHWCFSVSLPAVQWRLCHRTHQKPAHARPAFAGAPHLIHLIQCPAGKMVFCEAAERGGGCKYAENIQGEVLFLYDVGTPVLRFLMRHLWSLFSFSPFLPSYLIGSPALAQQQDHSPWRQREQHPSDH